MSESLPELLERAGHRPAKHGKRWYCANCPPNKPAALSVTGEVFHCFRCGTAGNIVTLKKELGILSEPPWTKQQRRRYAKEKAAVKQEAADCVDAIKRFRLKKIFQFRRAFDLEIYARQSARELLDKGEPVPDELLDAAFTAGTEADRSLSELNQIDDSENLRRLVEVFKKDSAA